MLKVKISDIQTYKKLVESVVSVVNPAASSPKEKAVLMQVKEGKLFLTAISKDSHKICLSMSAVTIESEGQVYIQADPLKSMTKALSNNMHLTVELTAQGLLKYSSPGVGSIQESVFYEQEDVYLGIGFGESKFQPLLTSSVIQGMLAKAISSAGGSKDSQIYLKIKEDLICAYAEFSSGSMVKYSYEGTSFPFSAYYKPDKLKPVLAIGGEEIKVTYNPVTKGIQFSSGSDYYLTVGSTIGNDFSGVDWAAEQVAEGTVIISSALLKETIQWQAYGIGDNDSISLKATEEEGLIIKGGNLNEPAILTPESCTEFKEVTFPFKPLIQAIESVSVGSPLINLNVVETQIDEDTIKMGVLSPWEDKTFGAVAVLYEQASLND